MYNVRPNTVANAARRTERCNALQSTLNCDGPFDAGVTSPRIHDNFILLRDGLLHVHQLQIPLELSLRQGSIPG